jgi:monoamine oxidase
MLKDWAFEQETATEDDLAPLAGHPTYGLPHAARDLWDGRLLFGSTEMAPNFGGYLEGALEAAELTAERLATEPPDFIAPEKGAGQRV